ncbi:MAG: Gfo/Idh/MocA family oxidoreductase [Fimbriimonadaceae bacterium]|nr:Gfo/Idh/MocA family oxidoreductase [Chthonomonadaceae bacterium]MCO5298174.1 Gfo/Idh/MocA family oxidoreductase [Fimbriimonadaceae bacterium]
MRTVRFGVVGCGLMGREFASAAARWCHLEGVSAKPEIVAVCDADPAAMEWFGAHFEVPLQTTRYSELLADPAVEAVYCAVPHHRHEELYTATLAAGKHLFAEKPFGIDLPAAERISAAVDAKPELLVRCSSEFPYFPGAQRIAKMASEGAFGRILEVRAGFCHSSDLDPNKAINWKRRIATNGEYGCMGDLGLHVLHLPLRLGFRAKNVRALLSNVVETRPDGHGGTAPCETWDNAILACESTEGFPMIFETKRISPGDTNTWSLRILGTKNSAEFSTRHPKTLRTMPYEPGGPQAWREEDLGYAGATQTITGSIFEFGFTDAILQMWAAYLEELAGNRPAFPCATPEEALASHRLFTAALESQRTGRTVEVG